MGRSVLLGIVAGVVALVWAAPALSQSPTVFVDDGTPARYNAALGMSLDATQNQFPCANVLCGDPIINPAPEPDLSAASAVLGDWLSNPPVFDAAFVGCEYGDSDRV